MRDLERLWATPDRAARRGDARFRLCVSDSRLVSGPIRTIDGVVESHGKRASLERALDRDLETRQRPLFSKFTREFRNRRTGSTRATRSSSTTLTARCARPARERSF